VSSPCDVVRPTERADLELVADAIARAAPREGDALDVQLTADVLLGGPRGQTMPIGKPQRIRPAELRQMHTRWRAGDRTGAARALLDVWVFAYGLNSERIAEGVVRNIVSVSVETVDPLVLTIELVPMDLWGKNLHSLLPRSRWDRLRGETRRRNGDRCEICRTASPLECDEVWAYDVDARVARLVRLRMICEACHRAKHFGRTGATSDPSELEDVIAHFCRVNGCDRRTFEVHWETAQDLWRERNRAGGWTVDLGIYARETRA